MQYCSTVLKKNFCIDHIIMVHYFEYSADLWFEGEAHDFWEFVYVAEGCIEVYADDVRHVVKKGEVLFHQPNEFHTLRAYDGTCPNLVVISFISHDSAMNFFRHRQLTVSAEERQLLSKILAETRNAFSTPVYIPMDNARMTRRACPVFGSEQMLQLYLEQFLIGLYRKSQSSILSDTLGIVLNFTVPHSDNSYVEDTLQYLLHNVQRPLHFADICQAVGIGRSRLQQLFSAELGCGVMEYSNRIRAAAAKLLLRNRASSVSEVAELLGFASTAYFSSFFKNIFGQTPTQYRQAVLDITDSVSQLCTPRAVDALADAAAPCDSEDVFEDGEVIVAITQRPPHTDAGEPAV